MEFKYIMKKVMRNSRRMRSIRRGIIERDRYVRRIGVVVGRESIERNESPRGGARGEINYRSRERGDIVNFRMVIKRVDVDRSKQKLEKES